MELALGFLLGLIVGAVAVYIALRRREAASERAQAELSNAFKALAGDALKSNNQAFLDLAAENLGRLQDGARADLTQRQQAIDAVLTPLKEALGKVEGRIGELEQARVGAYTALREQVGQLLEAQGALRGETATLAKALRAPSVRGRWGELQLRRVVELAGLVDRVDFSEQPYVAGEDGAIRPDMTVRLPGGGIVVVDAKAPLTAYLAAHEATDETKQPTSRPARRSSPSTPAPCASMRARSAARATGRSSRNRPNSSCCSCPARRCSAPHSTPRPS
jgi:DNA recombination protein RmuC